MLVHPPGLVAAAVGVVDLVVERAVGPLGHTVLLEHVRVERLALAVAGTVAAVAFVVLVLGLGVGAADVHVKGAGEEFGAHAVLGVVDGAVGTSGGGTAAGGSGGESVVGLLVTVGASNDDVEIAPVAAKVVGGGRLDAGAPESALEIRDRGGLGAVGARIEAGVALDVEVEGGAKRGVVAPRGAILGAVSAQGVEAQVGIRGDGGVKVGKGFSVAVGGSNRFGEVVELGEGFKGFDGVWGDLGAVPWTGLVGIVKEISIC